MCGELFAKFGPKLILTFGRLLEMVLTLNFGRIIGFLNCGGLESNFASVIPIGEGNFSVASYVTGDDWN
jgi:hypothetical protein